MTAGEWARAKAIFDQAAELLPRERELFLAQACLGDDALLTEVSSLLFALDQAGDFIDAPAPGQSQALSTLAADPAFHTGASIGPYRIVQVIGEGGMGMVYQAVRVDDLYRKLVALKVVRRGLYSVHAVRRFETERHILAHLDHPNIAKLLDGGTTADGQPFFVMDFIAGTPIDEYCDQERLSLRNRLGLFLTVCSAVQYAHQNFVVHRDIKPQNILVTAEGAIRLLDFGIAKLLDPDAEGATETISVVQMMTPEYASPEQLLNEPVTTASDTYSLGVLLYVLVTGHKPFLFKTRSVQEICDVIRHTEPRQPSSVVLVDEISSTGHVVSAADIAAARAVKPGLLVRELSGDLDNILRMALRREPERRYPSVEQLSGDIERHLDGRPVSARQDTFAYRATKFIRRHQGAVIAASLAMFLLIAGTITTSWEAHVAMRERERAERRFNDVRRVANSLLFDVHDAIRDLPGSAAARRLIVTKALEFLDSLSQDAGDDHELQRELAAAWERLGDVQVQSPQYSQPGDAKGALISYRKALAIRERLSSSSTPADPELRRDLLPNLGKIGDLLWSTGDAMASLGYSRKMLLLSQSLAAAPGATRQDRVRLATSYLDYGYKHGISGADSKDGISNCRKALVIFNELAGTGDKRLLRVLAIADDRAAELLEKQPGGYAEALQLRQTALTLKIRLLNQEPLNTDYRQLVAQGHLDIATRLRALPLTHH